MGEKKSGYLGVLVSVVFILLTSFYPIIVLFTSLANFPNNPVSIGYRTFYLLISLVVLAWVVKNIKTIKVGLGGFLLVVFWMMYSIRMFYDLSVVDIKAYQTDFYFYSFGIGGCFIPCVAIVFGARYLSLRRLLRVFFFFLLLTNLSVMGQLFNAYGFGIELFTGRPRVTAESGNVINAISVSKYGTILALFSTFFLFFREFRIFSRHHYIFILGMIIGLGNLLLGASRGAMASFLIVVLLLIGYKLYFSRKNLKYFLTIAGSSFLGVLSLVYVVIPAFSNQQFSLAVRIANGIDAGFGEEVRAYQWAAAWQQIKSSPIVGDRMVEDFLNFYPHNLYIEVVLSLGVLGGVVFLLAILVFSFRFLVALKRGNIVLVFFFIMLAEFSFGMSGISIPTGNHFWAFLSLCLGVNFMNEFDLKNN